MSSVQVEIMPWLSRYFVAGHSGRAVFEREVSDGTTVRELLEDISSHSQEFRDMIFDARSGRLAGHVSIILNGRFLELAGGLEARLRPGDTIRLMPGFSGG